MPRCSRAACAPRGRATGSRTGFPRWTSRSFACPDGELSSTDSDTLGPVMAAPVEIRLDRGEPLSPGALAAIPAFEGVAPAQWERYPGAAVLRRFSPGEIVCREGEHGSTAFVVLEGIAEVSIRSPLAHVETKQAAGGWLRRVKSRLAGAGETPREGDTRRMIPVDAPVDLSRDRPVAELGPGSLFGEMTCLSFYPRSATVRARGELVVVEMLRNILQVLQRTPAFKKRL